MVLAEAEAGAPNTVGAVAGIGGCAAAVVVLAGMEEPRLNELVAAAEMGG